MTQAFNSGSVVTWGQLGEELLKGLVQSVVSGALWRLHACPWLLPGCYRAMGRGVVYIDLGLRSEVGVPRVSLGRAGMVGRMRAGSGLEQLC